VKKAFEIAVENLRSNYVREGIFAGKNQFDDVWARDAMFASFGALELGDFEVVKKTLNTLLKYQREDGLLPSRVGDYHVIWKLLGFKQKREFRPRYVPEIGAGDIKDSNSLVIIIANEYVKKSKDLKFGKRIFGKLRKALDYYRGGLIEQEAYADWADSIPRRGKVLYTNVLYWKAVVALEELGKRLKVKERLKVEEGFIKSEINRTFWNGNYFRDVENSERFASDGNVLAVVFGLATKAQEKKILDFIRKKKLEEFTLKQSFPEFEDSSLYHKLTGVGDYHNLMWLWVGCLFGVLKKGMLEKIAEKINEYGTVYEVYELDGRPVKRGIYKSEENFSWSAGLFVWAVGNAGGKD